MYKYQKYQSQDGGVEYLVPKKNIDKMGMMKMWWNKENLQEMGIPGRNSLERTRSDTGSNKTLYIKESIKFS